MVYSYADPNTLLHVYEALQNPQVPEHDATLSEIGSCKCVHLMHLKPRRIFLDAFSYSQFV
jgi:hypothetical protein